MSPRTFSFPKISSFIGLFVFAFQSLLAQGAVFNSGGNSGDPPIPPPPVPCKKYLIFMRTVSPKSPGHFCVDPFWTGDIDPRRLSPAGRGYVNGSTLIDGMSIIEWIMKVYADQQYCYIGYARSDEEYEKWWRYYAPNWERVPCGPAGKFYGSGSLGIVKRPSDKEWWKNVFVNPSDFSNVAILRKDDHILIQNIPYNTDILEVGRTKTLLLDIHTLLAIEKGHYTVQNGEAHLGRIIKTFKPMIQCGDGGCCTSDPSRKAVIYKDVFLLTKNDGACTAAQFIRPDDVEEEDFHTIETDILDGIAKVEGEGGGELGIIDLIDIEDLGGIVCPVGELIEDLIDITIDDILIGKIVNPVGDEMGNIVELVMEFENKASQSDKTAESAPLLSETYPNPFNPSTKFSYTLSKASNVHISVYNLQGREVAKLVNGLYQEAGSHQVTFDAGHLPSGTYLYRITAGNYSITKQIQLLK